MTKKHYSDCAIHNEPAYPAGDCDCGGYEDISEIEALRAENARLREALKPFAELGDMVNSYEPDDCEWHVTSGMLRAARAAMGETK